MQIGLVTLLIEFVDQSLFIPWKFWRQNSQSSNAKVSNAYLDGLTLTHCDRFDYEHFKKYHKVLKAESWLCRVMEHMRTAIYFNWDRGWRCMHLSLNVSKRILWHVCPTKTQINRAVLSDSSFSVWRNFVPLPIQNASREGSDKTAWMRRLIWVITKTRVFKYIENFTSKNWKKKIDKKNWYFSYFCSKHRL